MILRWMRQIAYPVYECENCIGMQEYGCYCAYYNASAPGVGPTRWQRFALWFLGLCQ